MPGTAARTRIAAGALAALLAAGGLAPAAAAVRLCKEPVSSGPVAGTTETAARAAALAIWKAKALAHGEPYASWRLAAGKLLECLPRKEGGYECLARGAPCTIEQAPGRRHLRQKRLGI